LPYIRDEDARALVEAAVELLIRDFGYARAAERPKERAKANGYDTDGPADWAYLIDAIRNGRDLHDSTRDYSAKLITSGMAEGAAVNLTRAELDNSQAPHDERWQERRDDVPRMVQSLKRVEPPKPKIQIIARPYAWPDPAKIPPRQFLYGRHYIRKTIGATIGAGGRGKTTLGPLEFVGMACGRNLLTGEEFEPLRVWMLNAEEEQDELDRRTAAICKRYEITEADCGGRLFMQSVLHTPMRFATLIKTVPVLDRAVLDQFEAEIRTRRIDVFGLDPWVSFHSLNESSNEHMDLLIKEGLRNIASRTSSAGEIFHHPGKPKPGQADTTVEDARGASAIIWAVRSARVLNFMAPEDAKKIGITEDDRRLHIRTSNGKANMGPLGKASWFKLAVENLPNGDEIACASPWKPPDPFNGVSTADMHKCRTLAQTGAYRLDPRSPEWIGYVIAEVLKINVAHGAENDPNRQDQASHCKVDQK
jgi:hypothetical protein